MERSLKLACASLLLAGVWGGASAAIIEIPQSALVPTQQLYTDTIGGGIGAVAVMTGGGNAANVGLASGRNDDGFMGPINLGFTLSFFGGNYSQFYANNNGNISFLAGNSSYIPTGPIGANTPTIAIWFGDVDTRNAASGVMHIRQDADQLIVTWDHVGYYNSRADQLNTFQMVVRGPNYNVPFGEGAIGFFWLGMGWEDTDTSTTAAIGFGNGQGDGVVLKGSNTAGLNSVVAYHKIWFDPNLRPIEVPEPGTLALLGFGVVALGALRRRKSLA